MEQVDHIGLVILAANSIHGLVALVWMAGLRRFAGPLKINVWTDLLSLSLVLPALVGIWYILGLPGPPGDWALMRVDRWTEAVLGWGFPWSAMLLLLLLGTTALFVIQEALPAWRWRRSRLTDARSRDSRLESALERVLEGYAARGPRLLGARRPVARRLETDRPVAALEGLVDPVVLVSRGLLDKLDDDELDAALAHELAHLARGGNARLLVIWVLRALQASSPAALVLARNLFEAQEAACDAIATCVTGRPAVLAETLLKVYSARRPTLGPEAGKLQRAHAEVMWRSDFTAMKIRVRALLDRDPTGATPRRVLLMTVLALGGLLWAIH